VFAVASHSLHGKSGHCALFVEAELILLTL